jgi:hypothetical protein
LPEAVVADSAAEGRDQAKDPRAAREAAERDPKVVKVRADREIAESRTSKRRFT